MKAIINPWQRPTKFNKKADDMSKQTKARFKGFQSSAPVESISDLREVPDQLLRSGPPSQPDSRSGQTKKEIDNLNWGGAASILRRPCSASDNANALSDRIGAAHCNSSDGWQRRHQ